MSGRPELRTGYFGDRASFLALADLLEDTFDIDIGLLDRFGGPDPTAMPFGYFDDSGRCVANFSAFSMPVVVDGRTIRAVGYQSGAVRPNYRGRGLYRDLMGRAFDWAQAAGFEAGLLLTDKPDLYRPYGFEIVPQSCFKGPMPAHQRQPDARPISLDDAADLALLTTVLDGRSPPSERFSAWRQTRTFLLNACFDPGIRLSYLPGLEAVAAWTEADGVLRLLDVAAPEMPALTSVLAALGTEAEAVEVLFAPDRLNWDGQAEPFQGLCHLMVKPLRAHVRPGGPFMLSPMSDF